MRSLHLSKLGLTVAVAVALFAGCRTAPKADPTAATVWGYVRLVPKANAPATSGAYGDRRLSNVKRVDYSHPRFAVVFAPNAPSQDLAPLEIGILDGPNGAHLEPSLGYATVSQGLAIRNQTGRDQIVSAPRAGWTRSIAEGESIRLGEPVEGELILHVFGGSDRGSTQTALIWIVRGVGTEVDAAGRYVLDGLDPGRHELRAWHPRLPPTQPVVLDLSRGAVERLDLEIGVDAGNLQRGGAQ